MADIISLLPDNLEGIVTNAIANALKTSGGKKTSSKHTIDIDINVNANDKASKTLGRINEKLNQAIQNKAKLLTDKYVIKKKDIPNKDILGSSFMQGEYDNWYREALDFYNQFYNKLDFEQKKGGPSKHDANQFIKNAYKIMAYHNDQDTDMPSQLDDLLSEMEQLYIPDKNSPGGVKLKYDTFKIGNTASVEYDKLISKAKKAIIDSNQQDFGTIVIHQDGQTQAFDKNSDMQKMVNALLSFAQSFKDPVFHKGIQPKDLPAGETFSKGDSIGGLFLKQWFSWSSGSGEFLSPNLQDITNWTGSAESSGKKHLYVYDLADQKNLLNLNQIGLDIEDWSRLSAAVNNFAAVVSGFTSHIDDYNYSIDENSPLVNDPEELYRSNMTTLQKLNISLDEFASFLENEVEKYKSYIRLLNSDEIYTKQHAGEDLLNYMGYNGISMTGVTSNNDTIHGSHVGNMNYDVKWIDFSNPDAAQEIISLVYSQLYSSIADNIKMKWGSNDEFLFPEMMGREISDIAERYTKEVYSQQMLGVDTSQTQADIYRPDISLWQELHQKVQDIIQAKKELSRQTIDDDRGIQRQIGQFNQLGNSIVNTADKLKLLEQYITGKYGKLNYLNTFFANGVEKIQQGENVDQVIKGIDQAYDNYTKLVQVLTSYNTSGFNELQKEAWENGTFDLFRYNGSDFFTQQNPMEYIANISSFCNAIIDKKEAISPITGEVFTFDSSDANVAVLGERVTHTIQDLIQYIIEHFEGSITKFAQNAKDYLFDDLFVDIMSDTGMYDKQTGEMLFKQINHGLTNLGGVVGKDYTIIQRPGHYESKISSLKPQINEAALLGANVGEIVDVIKDLETGTMFDIQKTMPGNNIADSLQYLEATDQQILKLIDDIHILQKTGLYIDIDGDNVLYDEKQGFSLIDLANKKKDFTANTLEEFANFYLKKLDIKNGFDNDGFAQKIIQMSQIPSLAPTIPVVKSSRQSRVPQELIIEDSDIVRDAYKPPSITQHPISGAIINSLEHYIGLFNNFQDYVLEWENAIEGSKTEQYNFDAAKNILSKFPEFFNINQYIIDQEQMLEKFYNSFVNGFGYEELTKEVENMAGINEQIAKDKIKPIDFDTFKEKVQLYQKKIMELNEGNEEAYADLIPIAEEIPEIGEVQDSANIDQLKELYQKFLKNNFLSQYTEEQISQFSELQKLYESWELDLDEIQSRVGFDIDEQTLKLSNWYKEPIPEMVEISTRDESTYDEMYDILKRSKESRASTGEDLIGNGEIHTDQSEIDNFNALEAAIQAVINAINLKNEALIQESSIIQGSVPDEIQLFNSLLETLTQIAQLVQNMKIDFTINGLEDTSSIENLGKIAELIKQIDGNFSDDISIQTKLKDLGDAFNAFNNSINKMNPSDNLSRLSDFVSNISKAGNSLSDMATILKKTSGVFDKTVYANDKNTQDRVSDILNRYKEVSSPAAVSKAAQLQFNQDNGLILDTKDIVWLSEYNSKVQQLETDVSLLNQELNNTNSTISLTQNGFDLLRNAQERFEANTATATEAVQNQEKQFVDYSARIKEVQNELNRIPESQKLKFSNQYDDLSNGINKSIQKLQENKIKLEDFNKEVKQYFKDFERVQKGAPGDIFAKGVFGGDNIEKAKSTINDYLNSNYNQVIKNLSGGSFNKDGLYSFSAQVVDVDNKVQNLKITWDSLNGTISKVSIDTGKTWSNNFTQFIAGLKKETQKLFTYWTAQYLNPYRIVGSFKQVINIVREYDDALTEMRKVSDESVSTLQQFQKESFGIADSLGTTAKTIQNSTADWLRLGESFDEAKKSAEVSNLLLNVSEFTNIDDATQSLVSASQAYKDLDKIEIVDKLNNIGNNFSVSTDQLAKGLQNAAAVLHTQGNDIDQSLALLTAGNAITQDISKTSAGIRTISLRISGTEEAKNEIQDMGEDIDDFVVRTKSKTDQIIRDYTAVASNAYKGVSVLDENGNLRDTYDILLDIAKIYKEIQSEDKERGTNRAQALVEQLAGKNRSNIAASILENPELLQSVYEASQNSTGSAQKENEKYLDSISGKMQQMQNHLEEMANIVANSDGLKIILDLVNSILTGVTKLVDAFGGLNGIIGAAGGFLLQKGGFGINKIPTSMTKLGTKLGGLFSKEFGARMSEELKENFVLLGGDIDADIGLKNIVEANGGIENMSTELQEYINKIGEARYESITLGDAISENSKIFQGFGGVVSKVASIGSTLLTTFGTMLAVTAISAAIGAGVKAISNYIHRQEIAIQKGNEAKSNIEEITKAYQEQKDVVDNFDANEYEKLQEKQSRNALSTEEYEKFVTINNQLAEIFPELISSYDEQGNAILSLGDSAETATQQLNNLLNQEQQIAQYNLNEELGIATKGMFTQIDILQDDIEKQNQIIDTFNDFNDIQSNNGLFDISVDAENSQLRAAISQAQVLYEKAITDNGGYLKQAIYGNEEWDGDKLIAKYVLEPVFDESSKGNLEQALKDYNVLLEKYNIDLSGQYSEAQMKKTEDLREIAAEWNSIAPSLIGQMGLYDEFNQIGPELQQRIRDSITQIDVTKLTKDDRNLLIQDPRAFVRSAFLDPIWNAISDSEGEIDNVKKSVFDKLLSFDGANKTNDEYKDYINNFIEQLTSDEEVQSEIRMILKFTYEDENGNEIWNVDKQSSDIYDFFGVNKQSKSSQSMIAVKDIEAMTQEQKDALQSMIQSGNISFDPMKILPTELFKRIDEYIAKQKQNNNISTGTLSDLLNDESYKESAEQSESNLSSLTGALDTLRTEGQLTAEQMVDLQETFPNLIDFSSESLKTVAFEELDKWITQIRDHMDDMSPEGIKQAQTYIQNLIDSYGDLDVEMSDIMDTYFDVLGIDQSKTSGQEMSGLTQDFYSQVEELRSRLAARGEELDTHVLYTLVASDQFSGTADQILEKYDGAKVYYQITVDEKQAARDIAIAESRIQSEQAKRSAKEARGETITPEDYETELNILNDKVETTRGQTKRARSKWKKALQEGADQEIIDGLFSAYQEALSNQQQAEADAANTAREATESSANEALQELEDSNNALKEAQNKVTEAQKDGGEASSELYEAVASEQDNQAEINRRLGDIFQGFADNADNDTDKIKWQGQANDYYAAAIQAEADAMESRNNPTLEEYNKLQTQSEQIQREITKAEQNHQKVSKKTYQELISNGKAQIRNLQQQQSEVKEYSDKWWELQNSIDSMSDSIYEWDTTSKSLIYDQASQLASTITTAIQESVSETGLSTETINALLTGFSDLTGKDLDVSDAFYNTADGVKVNTEALRELTQAEFDLMSTGLSDEIQSLRDKMEGATDQTVWNSYNDQLQQLMQTQAQYFAQYEEMQKALSYNNAIDIAEGTENKGANYDNNYSRWKNYKKAYEKGEVGTDEFKAFTAYGDVFGRNTYEAFESVMGKFERYFTEDATVGIDNFLQDLKSKGLASYSEEEGWSALFENEEDAARAMGMGPEFFHDMFGKIQDFGGYYSKVGSLTEYELNKQDLNSQLEDALDTYTRMYESGKATTDELEAQKQVIQDIRDQIGDNEINKDNFVKDQEKKRVEDFTNLKDNLQMYQQLYDEATTDAEKDTIRKMAQKEISKYGYDLKEGEIALSKASQKDYESRFSKKGTVEQPLTATEMGISEEDTTTYKNIISQLKERYGKDGNLGELLNQIHRMSAEELKTIDHADGQWSAGEEPLEKICDLLDVSYDNANLLVDALAGLGLIEFPGVAEVPDALADGRAQVEEFLRTKIGKTFKDFNLDADVTKMGADDLNTLIGRYESLRKSMGVEAGTDVDQFISSKIREAQVQLDIQTRIDGGSRSIEDLRQMTDEELANEFQLDLNTDEGQAKLEELHTQLESMETGYDYTIHVDDTQFADLMEAITGEPYEQDVVLNPNTDELDTTEEQIESNPIEVPVVKQDLKDDIWVKQANRQRAQQTAQEEPSTYRDNETDRDIRITAHYDGSEVTEGLQQSESEIENTDAVVTMTPDTKEVDAEAAEIKKTPIIQTVIQKAQNFAQSLFGSGQQQQQDVQASAQLDTSKGEKELGKFSKDVSNINKTSGTATADINISAAMGKIAVLKDALNSLSGVRPMPIIDQTSINNAISRVNHLIERLNASKTAGSAIGTAFSIGTAHASGTTSLSRAYAGGKDWTVGRDESALVNEIGQESRVRDGVWELIPGGPHVEDLRKNDIIFSAEQTADLIRTGKTARRGKLVAHAKGTADGIPAFVGSTFKYKKAQKKSSTKKDNTKGGNGGNNGGKNGKSTSNKKSEFEKWLEKLFDWIEVRLDRIQRRIDISTTKAENAIGKLDSKGQSLIGTISENKNANINSAMRQIASNAGEVSEKNTYIKQKNGKVTSAKGGSTNTLLGASVTGALRYQQQADEVAQKALNKNIFKSKKRKSKASQQKYMDNIISLIHSGTIDIKEYSGDVKKFIEAYKEWYDKSQDLVKSTEELRQQYKELQQTKLDNIVDEFDTLVGLSEAVKASSEAAVSYYEAAGRAVGTKDEEELEGQKGRQKEITNTLKNEIGAYKGELINAERVFGKNSNEYREAQTKLEEMNKSLIESQTAELELAKQIRELSFTIRGYFITRVKAFVDKLGSIASLAEKRGTTSVYGIPTRQTEDLYFEQTKYNNELILKYYEDIKDKQAEIQEFKWEVNNKQYEEAYSAITSDESAIISLLSTNEDLKDSIRSLRWKPYEELNKELDDTVSDLQHINSFIRDGEILDDDGQITERGFAQIALIAEQMDVAEKKIRNANAAMEKLGEERDHDVISTEEYNEALDEQIKIIQDASSSLYDDQTKLADIYIDQITKENDILQDLIQSRKEALSAKKEYYDYDKTLRSKNKDIAQLQAQINALQGVTNDAAIAKRTKLQAELAEKQEDLNDTLYNHSIDLQQEGYDKLSEDMQTALDNAINAINGDFKKLQDTSALMLQQLETNNVDEAEIIRGIVGENATTLHSSTDAVIKELSGEGGVKKLLEGLGVKLGDIATLDIAGAINSRTPDSAVSNINTVLSIVENSLGEDIEGDLREIELSIGTLKLSEEQKNQINSEIEKLEGIDNKTSDIKEKIDTLKGILEQSDKTLQTISGNTAKGNDNVGGNVNNTNEPVRKEDIEEDKDRVLSENKQNNNNATSTLKKNVTNAVNTYKKSSSIADYAKLLRLVSIPPSMSAMEQWTLLQKKLKDLNISATGIKMPPITVTQHGYAKGAKNLSKDVLAWTNEDWNKIGSEMIVRPSDGAILTPLKANDSVIPANLADNLFKWGAISPDKFITNPFVGKWSAEGGGSVTNNADYTAAPQTVEMHFDSLFHIEGNVDESVMPRLENLGKSLVNDKDFQKNVIKFVTKDFVRESKKQGIR